MKHLFFIVGLLFSINANAQWCDCCDANSGGAEPTITKIFEERIQPFALGFGYNNSVEGQVGATVTNLSNGRYRVTFTNPHPNGALYDVVFGSEEDANRDNPKQAVERGSKTATGFIFMNTVDDNGATADIYDPSGWSFVVHYQTQILTDVTID